jgi:hypothetical protein
MIKSEIYNLLKEVFHEFNVHTLDRDPFNSIFIHSSLQVFTYSPQANGLWYFKDSGQTWGKETQIPKEFTKEFLEVYLEIFKQGLKANELLEEIRNSLKPENLEKLVKSQIRNRKLEGLIPLNN